MTGVIRLDAIPIMGLPQIVKSDPVEPASTKVNCVLHCEAFPTTQHLEVRVNGALQQQVEEGHQLVFCWQLATATDEVRIKLFKRGVLEQHWQGCWNERDALLSLGTLPVQVFFDGRLQPPVAAIGGSTSAATLKALQPGPEEGSSRESGAVLSTSSNGTHEPGKPESELRATNGVVVVQDLIVVAEPKSVEEVPLLDDRGSEEVQVQEREERQDDGEEREAGAAEEQKQQEGREEDNDKQSPNGDAFDEWDDEEYPELEEEYEEGTFGVHEENGSATGHEDEPEAVRKNEPGTAGQGEMEEQEAADLSEQEGRGLLEQEQAVVHADLHTVDGITVMRPRLAAFHASSVTPQKTLEALKALVATMAMAADPGESGSRARRDTLARPASSRRRKPDRDGSGCVYAKPASSSR